MVVDSCIKVQLEPCNIAYLNWIIEGYEHIGIVSTLDREKGIVLIQSTPDMLGDLKIILQNFDFPIMFVD